MAKERRGGRWREVVSFKFLGEVCVLCILLICIVLNPSTKTWSIISSSYICCGYSTVCLCLACCLGALPGVGGLWSLLYPYTHTGVNSCTQLWNIQFLHVPSENRQNN